MPKVITSPSPLWPGTVTLAQPMFLPQAEAFEAAMTLPESLRDENGKVSLLDIDKHRFPALLVCVESWNLEGIASPPSFDTFPLSPRLASHELQDWIWSEIRNIYFGDLTIPNVSSPTPTDTQAKDDIAEKSQNSTP